MYVRIFAPSNPSGGVLIYLREAFTGVKGSKGYTTKSPLLAIRSSHRRCDLFKVQSGSLSRHVKRVLEDGLGQAGGAAGSRTGWAAGRPG